MKGHARIELTDVNTKEVTVIEQENLITNAVKDRLNMVTKISRTLWPANPYIPFSFIKTYMQPLYQKMYQGILLFENELEEDVNNKFIPNGDDNKLVGYASTDAYSSEDARRGSFNASESEFGNGVYKYVWDFTTNQGNGQISALSLTTPEMGKGLQNICYSWSTNSSSNIYPLVSDTFKQKVSVNSTEGLKMVQILEFDEENFTFVSGDVLGSSVVLYTWSLDNYYDISLDTAFPQMWVRLVNQETISIPNSNFTRTSAITNGGDGYYYIGDKRNTSNPFYLCRINAETHEYDTSFGTRSYTCSTSFVGYNNLSSSSSLLSMYRFVVFRGKAYLPYGTGTYAVIIDLESGNIDDSSIKLPNSDSHPARIGNYIVYGNRLIENLEPTIISASTYAGYKSNIFTTKSGLAIVTNLNSGSNYNFTCGVDIYMPKSYLGTICNLDTPVIKTSAQTMKITYTLTEEV